MARAALVLALVTACAKEPPRAEAPPPPTAVKYTSPAVKRAKLESLLSSGATVAIIFDARFKGVEVPASMRAKKHALLDLSIDPRYIPATLDDRGIHITLAEHSFECFVPWGALYVVGREGDETAVLWHDDAPVSTAEELTLPGVANDSFKVAAVTRMLASDPVFIYLDPRLPGVEVPDRFRADDSLTLRIGYHLAPPIPDLVVDDKGIRGTLTFNKQPYRVVVPWTATIGATVEYDRAGLSWLTSVPALYAIEEVAPPPAPAP